MYVRAVPSSRTKPGEAPSLILKSLNTSPWSGFIFTRAFKGIAARSELDEPLWLRAAYGRMVGRQ